jgi:hypothetical protein
LSIGAFVSSHPDLATPDIQFQIFPGSYKAIEDRKLDRKPGVTLLHLEDRGHVHAKSSDPKASPAI